MNKIKSLLNLQSESLKDPAAIEALRDTESRVQSMAILYDKLYRSADYNSMSIKEYLFSLIDEIINNFPNSNIVKIEKNIGNFILSAKKLQSVGIIINELLTNIMKYAFIDRNDGLISLDGQPVGGTWSGSPYIINGTWFDPSKSGVITVYGLTYTYKDPHGCQNS